MVDYLESLERLAMPDELHIKECEKLGIGLTEDFDIVEQALLELKSIKEASPSEALECLKALQSIRDKYSMPLTEYVNSFDYIKIIKQVLLKQQEQEKKNAEYKQLEEQLGCPLDIYAKIQSGLVDVIYVKRYETVRKYWDENGLQLEQKECLVPRSITRVDRRYFYYKDILGKEDMYFSKYGTEFWLKEDKSA